MDREIDPEAQTVRSIGTTTAVRLATIGMVVLVLLEVQMDKDLSEVEEVIAALPILVTAPLPITAR